MTDAGASQSSRLFKIIGWLVGLVYSIAFPKVIAPMNLSMSFDVSGALSGALGFAGMVWFLGKRNVSGRKKFFIALAALGLAIVLGSIYRSVLLAVENVTPDTCTRILELALYCGTCFSTAVVISYVYWSGGPQVMKMFDKGQSGSGG